MDILTAQNLDALDSLSGYPALFYKSNSDVRYLDGNSLGRLPLATIDRVNQFLEHEWGSEVVEGWSHWIDEAQRVGDLVGRSALGAKSGQTLVCDSTSINFYQLAVAAIRHNSDRRKIVTTASNFPTDRFVLQGIAQQFGLELVIIQDESDSNPMAEFITTEVLEQYLNDDVALICLQVVNYRSGVKQDVRRITQAARDRGVLVLWDAAHAVGSVELNFDEDLVDLAVGCTYKYGNSGPGAPAWLYVAERMQSKLEVPIQGWFAQANQFAMGADFSKAEGIRGFMVGTPNILGLRAVETAFEMLEEAGMPKIAEKASRGTDFMIELFEVWLRPLGFDLGTPKDATLRGGHISLIHPDAEKIAFAMREMISVIPDFRAPNAIRVAMSPLVNTYVEVYEAFSRLSDLVAAKKYLDLDMKSARVR
jgi:kynureninase